MTTGNKGDQMVDEAYCVVFPELSELFWPNRGGPAELLSLVAMDDKCVHHACPLSPEVATAVVDELTSRYPAVPPPVWLSADVIDFKLVIREVRNIAIAGALNPEGGCGWPYAMDFATTDDFVAKGSQILQLQVALRVYLLSVTPTETLLTLSAEQLVSCGLVDPVRVFIKQEPHKIKKRALNQRRLIYNVSIVDKIVEMLLWGSCAKADIGSFENCPS